MAGFWQLMKTVIRENIIATKKIMGFTVVITCISSVSILTIKGSNKRPIGQPNNKPKGIPMKESLIAFL